MTYDHRLYIHRKFTGGLLKGLDYHVTRDVVDVGEVVPGHRWVVDKPVAGSPYVDELISIEPLYNPYEEAA